MNNLRRILLLCLAFVRPVEAETNTVATNGVQITEGTRLLVTDEIDATNFMVMVEDQSLFAEKQLCWILYNTTSNRSSVVFLGMTNSFSFELKGTNGTTIPKTAKGKAMCAGPKSFKDFLANKPNRLGIGAGAVSMMDFPRITELFEMPPNGEFEFELRYWMWFPTNQTFSLSPPVRLKVLKEETSSAPAILKPAEPVAVPPKQ